MTVKEAKGILRELPGVTELVRVPEAALIMGVHEETLRRKIRKGELQAYGRPRLLKIRISDLLQPYDPNCGRE